MGSPRRSAFHPRALEDIDKIARYIAADRVDSGLAFLDAIETAMDRLRSNPGIGRAVESRLLEGVRAYSPPRFRAYRIFYRRRGDRIEVLRVMNSVRDLSSLRLAGGELALPGE